MNKPLFGVAGYPKNFLDSSHGKNRENIFTWLHTLGLEVFEFDWTYGINMSPKKIERVKKLSLINEIILTLRAPKEIDLLTENKDIYNRSLNDIDRCVNLAMSLNIKKIVISLGKKEQVNIDCYHQLAEVFKKYPQMIFYIEPNPRLNQFGSIEDIMEINNLTDNVKVYFNLANIHIREGLSLTSEDKIIRLFKGYQTKYPDIFKDSYFKIYPILYTLKKEAVAKQFGEIKTGQLSFFDQNHDYYPKASDYISALLKLDICPIVVSKTFESEEVGAMILRDKHYLEKLKSTL